MPEGPEIHRAAGKLAAVLDGQELEAVEVAFPDLEERAEELIGETVRQVDARGKAILIRIRGGLTIYSHNQLYGRWMIRRRDRLPKTGRSLRLALHTAKHSALLYSASEVDILHANALRHHGYLKKLGPDIVAEGTTMEELEEQVCAPRFRRRRLGGLLLDQGFLAGSGNYLRSEILFAAGLHPRSRPGDLSASELRTLAEVARTLARRSFESGGITTELALAERLKAEGARRREYRHEVFGRAGRSCRACGATIQRETDSGRRLYRCPTCQPAP